MTEELHALTGGKLMGRVLWDRSRDRLSFQYASGWREDPASFPLSLSLPLAAAAHSHRAIEAFLWGLLPESQSILNQWGTRFQVSPQHLFQLLSHVGEECAGAVQWVRSARVAKWQEEAETESVTWLDDKEIGTRMRLLLNDPSAARTSADTSHFCLSGAQPKSGFAHDPALNRWGVPSASIPTTHIFKPSAGYFDRYAENEHFCLTLAKALGLPVVTSAIHYFGDIAVLVTERYDRIRSGDAVRQIHQEDFCQTLGKMPALKYQNKGGPSAREIAAHIREHSSRPQEDESRFIDALLFNWLIAGTNGHPKNYSLLLASNSRVRLAPLYDLSSALLSQNQEPHRDAKLAMKIGGKYKLSEIGVREWRKCSAKLQVDFDLIYTRILELATRIPDAAQKVGAELKAQSITHEILETLTEALQERALFCEKAVR